MVWSLMKIRAVGNAPRSQNNDLGRTQTSKRVTFLSVQQSHVVPTKVCDLSRIRTGYEKMIAQFSSSTFVALAKGPGIVTKVNRKANMLRVDYDQGDAEVYGFGEEYSPTSGFYITQRLICVVEAGERVKQGQVLCYNDQFFKLDPYNKVLDYKTGILANVLLMESENTLEDSDAISPRLSDKLSFQPVHCRDITLSAKAIIHQKASIGDNVVNTDPLLIFENEEMGELGSLNSDDLSTIAMLSALNKNKPTAKHSGKIVKVDAFYACPLSDMHPSVAEFITVCNQVKNARAKLARGSAFETEYSTSTMLKPGTKYHGVTFDPDTVLLQFYIQEEFPHGVGDKLIVANQLKSTSNAVRSHRIVTESGREIDITFGLGSVANRIVVSPTTVGSGNLALEELENQALDIYFGSNEL